MTVADSPVAADATFYQSRIQIEPGPDRSKIVHLPAESEPVAMGFHGKLAGHYGLTEGAFTPKASTLDYLVAATAACMTGVLTSGLKARGIPVDNGRLKVEAVGDIEQADDGILFVRRIHVVAHLMADESHREAATRLAATFERQCPLYRSIHEAVEITSELDFRPVAGV